MVFGSGPKVQKRCPEGHPLEMSWRTCPRCTGRKARDEGPGRDITEMTVVLGAPPVAQPPPPADRPTWVIRLSATTGPATGQDFDFEPGRWRIGRGPRAEGGEQPVTVADPSMSRDHFVLEAGVAAVVLRDLGSTNGTFVNGTRVTRHMLQEGDTVRAGATAFLVRLALRPPS